MNEILKNEQNSIRASGNRSENKGNEQYNKMFKALCETVNEKLNNLENDGNAQGERDPPGKWTETRKTNNKVPGKHEQRTSVMKGMQDAQKVSRAMRMNNE